jgi:hypothetical protein
MAIVRWVSVSLLASLAWTMGQPSALGLDTPDWSKVRGFNYQPSFGSTGVEIWVDKFDATAVDNELRLGRQYFPGMNTVRLWMSPDAYIKNPAAFTQNFETTLKDCAKYGIRAIPTLFNNWHSVPDFGGISAEMVGYWFTNYGQNGQASDYIWRPYLTAMFQGHASDSRILAWDLCNEPFNSGSASTYTPWLQHTYNLAKTLGAEQPIGVSVGADVGSLQLVAACSDVLMIHPYFASGANWSSLNAYAAKCGKGLLATECCWGSLDDAARVSYIRSDLDALSAQGVGFLAHGLYESYVADLHRAKYGPVSSAGYMAFINMDGSLRAGHDVFNEYCESVPEPEAWCMMTTGLIGLLAYHWNQRRRARTCS